MGARMMWEVTGTAVFENSIWAARLRPVPATAPYHTDNPVPLVVLALKRGCRPVDAGRIENWQPVPPEKSFVIETLVGEKVILRVESDVPGEDEYESLFVNKTSKRKHPGDQEWHTNQVPPGGRNETRGYHSGGRGGGAGRGRGNTNRGNRNFSRGGGRGGRGRGGGHNYRSLDDLGSGSQHIGHRQPVSYEDAYPPLGSQKGAPGGRAAGGQQNGGTDLQRYY